MNNRIFELANRVLPREEDLIETDVKEYAYFFASHELAEFAELIVQDVIDILSTYRAKVRFDDGIEHNCQHPIYAIKKHFGVTDD
jgi:hypothetical protein